MAASKQVIPTELTLELGDAPTPAHFLKAARAFFGVVDDVAMIVAPDGGQIRWVVQVREGSNLLGLRPEPDTEPALAKRAYTATAKAIHAVERGKVEHSGLSDVGLGHLRTLAELAAPNGGPPTVRRVWVTRAPINVTPAIAETIAEDMRTVYQDYGTFEGKLEAIQDQNGRLQIRVHDHLLRQAVRCSFHDNLLKKAFDCFRKRVEVTGMIHYRKNDQPVSMDVADIELLPDDSELPTVDETRGILGARRRA